MPGLGNKEIYSTSAMLAGLRKLHNLPDFCDGGLAKLPNLRYFCDAGLRKLCNLRYFCDGGLNKLRNLRFLENCKKIMIMNEKC